MEFKNLEIINSSFKAKQISSTKCGMDNDDHVGDQGVVDHDDFESRLGGENVELPKVINRSGKEFVAPCMAGYIYIDNDFYKILLLLLFHLPS